MLDATLAQHLASGRLVEHGLENVQKHRVQEIERAPPALFVERSGPDLRAISLDHTSDGVGNDLLVGTQAAGRNAETTRGARRGLLGLAFLRLGDGWVAS